MLSRIFMKERQTDANPLAAWTVESKGRGLVVKSRQNLLAQR